MLAVRRPTTLVVPVIFGQAQAGVPAVVDVVHVCLGRKQGAHGSREA